MTMTDVSRPRKTFELREHVTKAREWLVASGYYTQHEARTMLSGRVLTLMNALYTGGWVRFREDTRTVENASEWELSW